jgi:hypothetical protein
MLVEKSEAKVGVMSVLEDTKMDEMVNSRLAYLCIGFGMVS